MAPRRARLLVAAVAVLQLVALLHWATHFGSQLGEDFDVHWAAARLLATGHRGDMYALAAQLREVHAGGVAGLSWLNHAGWGPVALLTVLPLTLLTLPAAIGAWTALQLAALVAATALALGDRASLRRHGWVAVAGLLVAPGLAALVALGQWEGFAALLVVLAWRDAAAGRRVRAALWALLLAGALPQVALGLLVFQVGLWGWRQLGTLTLGGATLAGASVALLGPAGVGAWLGQVLDLAREVPARDTDGLTSVAAAVAGSGPIAAVLSLAAAAAALAACWILARRTEREAGAAALLPTAALAVTGLSLLASPHLFDYTLVVLAPLAVATLRRPAMALLWTGLGLLTVTGLHVDNAWWRPAVPVVLLGLVAVAAVPARSVQRLGYALRW